MSILMCGVGNCPSGELSVWGIVRVGNCPVGNCPSGELSSGELSVYRLKNGSLRLLYSVLSTCQQHILITNRCENKHSHVIILTELTFKKTSL